MAKRNRQLNTLVGQDADSANALLGQIAKKIQPKKNAVDISKVQTGSRPGALQQIDAQAAVAAQQVQPVVPQFVTPEIVDPVLTADQQFEQGLVDEKTALTSELQTLQEKIASSEQRRSQGLEEAGVFEDTQRLTQLQNELAALEDREIAIPLEERQNLVGTGATQRDLSNVTQPKIFQNTLDQLNKSRQVQSQAAVIQTNMAIVNQKFDAELQANTQRYDFAQQRIDTVTAVHGDLISNRQKAQLELQKQEFELEKIAYEKSLDYEYKALGTVAQSTGGGALLASFNRPGVTTKDKVDGVWQAYQAGEMSYKDALNASMDLELAEQERSTAEGDEKTKLTSQINSSRDAITAVDKLISNEKGLMSITGEFGLFARGFQFVPGTEAAEADDNWDFIKNTLTTELLPKLSGAISEGEIEFLKTQSALLSRNKSWEENVEILQVIRTRFADNILKMEAKQSELAAPGVKQGLEVLQNDPELSGGPTASVSDFIFEEEGFRSNAYQDQTGTWTIGYGTTAINGRPVQPGDTISEQQARQIANSQIESQYSNFKNKVTVQLNENQRKALTSFEYNLGGAIWDGDGQSIINAINSGNLERAGGLMEKFVYSKGQKLPGLVNRRKRESNLLMA